MAYGKGLGGKPKTTTKTTKSGTVKKKTTGGGYNLKQKTKPSGQQKIKGTVSTKTTKYNVGRNKGVVKGKRSTM